MKEKITLAQRLYPRMAGLIWVLIILLGKSGEVLQAANITNPVITNTYTVTAGNTLVFNDSATNFSISEQILLQATNTGLIFNPVNNTWTVSGFGGLGVSGLGTLTLFGTGTTILAASNNYSGATTIQGGTLILSNAAGPALYFNTNGPIAGTIVFNTQTTNAGYSPVLTFGNSNQLGTNVSLSNSASLASSVTSFVTLNGYNQTIGSLISTTANPNITVQNGAVGNATLTLTGGTFNGQIRDGASGSLAIVKTGTGTFTPTGVSNTYTGGTTIEGGRVVIGNAGVLGTGAVTNNAVLFFSNSALNSFSNTLAGSGTLIKSGTGTLVLSGPVSQSGIFMAFNGQIFVTNSGSLLGGGILDISGSTTTTSSVLIAGSNPSSVGSIFLGTNLLASFLNTNSNSSGNWLIVSNSSLSSAANLTIAPGSGSLSNTVLVAGGGTLSVASNVLVGVNGSANLLSLSNGTLSAGGNVILSQSNASSSNAISLISGSLTATGILSLGTVGTDTLTMVSNSSVTAGTALIGTNGLLTGGGTITTTSGGLNIYGSMTPSLAEPFRVNGDLNFAGSSTYTWQLLASSDSGAGTNYTAPLTLNGNLGVSAGSTFLISMTNAVSVYDPLWNTPGTTLSWVVMTNVSGSLASGTNFTLAFDQASTNSPAFLLQPFSFTVTNNTLSLLYSIYPNLYVGSNSSSVSTTFSSGTNNNFYDIFVGYSTTATPSGNNTLVFTNSGTVSTLQNNLYVGYAGSGNSVIVSGGARLNPWQSVYIGNTNTESSNNTLLVTDAGSSMTIGQNLYVGYGALVGSNVVAGSGNSLIVSNGASVTVSTNLNSIYTNMVAGNIYAGNPGSSNDFILVTGTNSVLSAGTITLGSSTQTPSGSWVGGSATMTIADSGSISNSSVSLGMGSNSTGTLNFGTPGGSDTNLQNYASGSTLVYLGAGTSYITFNQSDTFYNLNNQINFNSDSNASAAIVQAGSGTSELNITGISSYQGPITAQILVTAGRLYLWGSPGFSLVTNSNPDMGNIYIGYQGSNSMGIYSNSSPVSMLLESTFIKAYTIEIGHSFDLQGNRTGLNNSNQLILNDGDNGINGVGYLVVGNGGNANQLNLYRASFSGIQFDSANVRDTNQVGLVVGLYGNSNQVNLWDGSKISLQNAFSGTGVAGIQPYVMVVGDNGNANAIITAATNFGGSQIESAGTIVGRNGSSNSIQLLASFDAFTDLSNVVVGMGSNATRNFIQLSNSTAMNIEGTLTVGLSNSSNYVLVAGYDPTFGGGPSLTASNGIIIGQGGNGNSLSAYDSGIIYGSNDIVGLGGSSN